MQTLSALLTPTVAIAVAVIAYLQWQTAHQKVLVDLFDRRLQAYDAIALVLAPVNSSGQVTPSNAHFELLKAMRDAHFLFGKDVLDYLEKLRLLFINMGLAETMMEEHDNDYSNWVRRHGAQFREVMQFYEIFPKLCEPYLRLDQKRVRSPWRALRDWQIRRSARATERKPGGVVPTTGA
jgi:protein-disulfide isomerase-like protein with CxxC motif